MSAAALLPTQPLLPAPAGDPVAAPPAPPTAACPHAPPLPPALAGLVEPDLWAEVPADLPALLALLPHADLDVQDELEVRLHPTLTRCWSRRGRFGQRKVRAPGANRKVVAFGAVDWRAGWVSVGFGLGRTATLFVRQLDHLVARSRARGRIALVLADNLRVHTPAGSKLLREALARHGAWLRLVYTPPYDPEANPIERLWQPLRRAVTHNHHRAHMLDLYHDLEAYFDALDGDPDRALRHIGSPFAATALEPEALAS